MEDKSNNFGSLNKKPRSKKLNTTIDLTAMVSVSFLLIVFFMVTTELSKPRVMNLALPNDDITCGGNWGCGVYPARVVTLLLDNNNKIISYNGSLSFRTEIPKILDYGKTGIRKELLAKKKIISTITGDRNKGIIVIIKPSKNSSYGNLVDILDEMAISNIGTYAIVNNYTLDEHQLLASR